MIWCLMPKTKCNALDSYRLPITLYSYPKEVQPISLYGDISYLYTWFIYFLYWVPILPLLAHIALLLTIWTDILNHLSPRRDDGVSRKIYRTPETSLHSTSSVMALFNTFSNALFHISALICSIYCVIQCTFIK